MRDYGLETDRRVEFIRDILKSSGAKGIVFGNSGGKDASLAGILCKKACDNTLSVIMPCSSKQNYGSDKDDAAALCERFSIDCREVDLTNSRESILSALEGITTVNQQATINIAPRLRMTTLYTIAASEGRIVCGTGNRSEIYMGYFTKWGDGASDFNPIGDLTATEIFEFLRYLGAPSSIIEKAPSAGLFEGQTDEQDMGVTYAALDNFLLTGEISDKDRAVIDRYHSTSHHKRSPIQIYSDK